MTDQTHSGKDLTYLKDRFFTHGPTSGQRKIQGEEDTTAPHAPRAHSLVPTFVTESPCGPPSLHSDGLVGERVIEFDTAAAGKYVVFEANDVIKCSWGKSCGQTLSLAGGLEYWQRHLLIYHKEDMLQPYQPIACRWASSHHKDPRRTPTTKIIPGIAISECGESLKTPQEFWSDHHLLKPKHLFIKGDGSY